MTFENLFHRTNIDHRRIVYAKGGIREVATDKYIRLWPRVAIEEFNRRPVTQNVYGVTQNVYGHIDLQKKPVLWIIRKDWQNPT
jgi:hypothetical protein